MTEVIIKRKNGHEIPCRYSINGNEKTVVVVSHGFASSMESFTVDMLMEHLPAAGAGVIAYDLPEHGSSTAPEGSLSVEGCKADLDAVAEYAAELCPDAGICYFGSSFGAYITLLYLTEKRPEGAKAFLRSAAVNMSDYFDDLSGSDRQSLDEKGFFIIEDETGRLKVTAEFINDLKKNDLRRLWTGGAEVMMIHGSMDEDIDYSEAVRFAGDNGIRLVTVPGGDHRLSIPGAPEKVMEEAVGFFA